MKTMTAVWQRLKPSDPVQIALFALALLIYIAALAIPVPPSLGFALRYQTLPVMVPMAAIVYGAFRLRQRWGWVVGLSAAFTLFGVTLAGVWSSAISDYFITAGLLPQTDASAYLKIAQGLVNGNDIYIGFLRPFAPFLLAALLVFTQQNLQVAIAIIVSIVALSTFLVSWEIRKTHGALTGAIVFTGLFTYYRAYLGTLMTEGLGLALGCLSFAILWSSSVRLNRSLALVGFAVLTFALLVRTGAVFVLPFTLLWGTFALTHKPRKVSWSFLAIGILIVLGASFYNSILTKYIAEDSAPSFGNYSYVLYGLLNRGNWLLIYKEHPEIMLNPDLSASERVAQVYQLCFDIIRDNPMALVHGIRRAWNSFINNGIPMLLAEFHHIPGFTPSYLEFTVQWLLRPLLALGLLGCLRFWRNPLYSLMLAMIAGIVCSIALAPVWDTGLRAYAVSAVVGYTLLGLGVYFLFRGIHWLWLHRSRFLGRLVPLQHQTANADLLHDSEISFNPSNSSSDCTDFLFQIVIWLSLLLIFLSAIFPVPMRIFTPRVSIQADTCPADQEARVVYYHPRSVVNLVPDDSIAFSKVPTLKVSDFQAGLWFLKNFKPTISDVLSTVKAGQSIIAVSTPMHIVAPTTMLPNKAGHYTVCGQLAMVSGDPNLGLEYSIFAGQSIRPAKGIPIPAS